MDMSVVVPIAAFVAVLALLVMLRARNSQIEIKATDIAVAVLPVVIYLLVTGKIQSFEVAGVKLESAFSKATAAPASAQATPLRGLLKADPVSASPKGGVNEIPALIQSRTEALVFSLGHGGYYGPAIQRYFDELGRYAFLRYVIFENPDRTLFGLIDAQQLIGITSGGVASPGGGFFSVDHLADALNAGNGQALFGLPGFIAAAQAVTEDTTKSRALQNMEDLKVDVLPVIGADQRLVGVVSRSRITASLILDVSQQLEK